MAKSTKHGGASNKGVEISTVTHSKSVHEKKEASTKEPEFQEKAQETEEVEDNYDEWTATDLRNELANRELSTTGRKPELVERLRESDTELDEDYMDDEDELESAS